MTTYRARVFAGGKIVLPAELRRRHGFDVGTTLIVDDAKGAVTIQSLDEAVAAAQATMAKVAPPERILSDELIQERRAAARHE